MLSRVSHVRLYAAHQALLSTGFSRQEYWSGLPFPSPGVLPRDLFIEQKEGHESNISKGLLGYVLGSYAISAIFMDLSYSRYCQNYAQMLWK